ncbi:hypothetical protein MNBD_ALPHA09-2111 [hydrothermal vent metagenome]|uniref:Uncharacterized protein n=1 Tax=hydrothermal vent metagenome TaxID=652676 RepID=A0A3B0TXW8_9ZZZZ
MEISIRITYDGLDADQHMLDMRRFGEAMLGLDKIVNTGLIVLSEYRFPIKGERFSLQIRAKEPSVGSFEFFAYMAPVAASTLQLVLEMFYTMGSDILWRWTSWIVNMNGGRPKEAEPHFTVLMELTKEIHKSRAESEVAQQAFFLEIADRLQYAAKGFVAPVGPSANSVAIEGRGQDDSRLLTHVDVPMANAIRSKEKLEVGDMEKMRIRIDGLIHHNKQLKVEHPDEPGRYISAVVRDPSFMEADNVYTRALARHGFLDISAKPSHKADGTIHTLYILDVKEVESVEPEISPPEGQD